MPVLFGNCVPYTYMDKKLLRWNFIFQYGWVLTNIFNSLLLTPLYLKNIHPDTLGIWWATGSVLGLMILVDPGVGEVLQQRIAELRGREEKEDVGRLIGSGYAMSVIVLAVSVLIGLAAYFFLGKIINKDISAYPNLSAALVITVIATGLSLVSFTMTGINQGLHNSAQVAISSLTANLVFLLVNILFLYIGWGVLSIAMANLCRAIYINAHNIISMLRVLKKQGIQIAYETAHLKRFIRIFSFTSTSKIISGLSYNVDMVVLARFTPGVITMYEVNRRPVNHFYALVGRHSVALMPSISHAKGKGDKESIIRLINQQFKFYSYAALFLAMFFCFSYNYLISAWIGPENFIGNTLLYLLAAQFFVSLMAAFMANVSYALGDIKTQSLYNIVRGLVFGGLMYIAAKYGGVKGVITGYLLTSLLADLTFFYYRVYKLGYLQRSLFVHIASTWVFLLPAAGLGGWGLTKLVNSLLSPNQYFAKLLVNGGVFSLLFFVLLLIIDRPFRAKAKEVSGKYIPLPFSKQKGPEQNFQRDFIFDMPKLVAMLRVKDGALFVEDWLRCFEKLVDEIVLLDNGSTDGTYETLRKHPKIVDSTRTEGYNEGRDKKILYAMMRKRTPDWCIWVDIDEIFEPAVTRADLDRLMSRSWVNQYGFRRYHFIDNHHFAGSGQYFFFTSIHDRVMWREAPTGYFEDKILDSPNVKGIKGIKLNTSLRLKHLGYISKELVDKKKEIYLDVIEEGREASLQKMYLHNEKKVRWNDNRRSWAVRRLNAQLNWMQFKSLFPRGYRKISKLLHFPFKPGRVHTA